MHVSLVVETHYITLSEIGSHLLEKILRNALHDQLVGATVASSEIGACPRNEEK
jgi:hypothetical protein